jgi:hypothetical protein
MDGTDLNDEDDDDGKEDEEDTNSIFLRASGSDDMLSGVNEENEQQEKDDKGGEGEIIGTADFVSVGAVSSTASSRRSASAIVRQKNCPPTLCLDRESVVLIPHSHPGMVT